MVVVNYKDMYKVFVVFFIVMGMFYLIDKFIGFVLYGLLWVM